MNIMLDVKHSVKLSLIQMLDVKHEGDKQMSQFDPRFDYFDARAEHEENELRIADEAAEFAAMTFDAQEDFLENERLAFMASQARAAHAALMNTVNTWRAAVTPRVAEIGNGLFVRVGTGRKNRRAA